MNIAHLILTALGGYLTLSALCTFAWCAMSWHFGTRDCQRPALRAAAHAQTLARREFIATHMTRH